MLSFYAKKPDGTFLSQSVYTRVLRATFTEMGYGSYGVGPFWTEIGLSENLGDICILGRPLLDEMLESWVVVTAQAHLVRPWWADLEPGLARLARAVLRRPKGGQPFMRRCVEISSLHSCADRLKNLCQWERERRLWQRIARELGRKQFAAVRAEFARALDEVETEDLDHED